MTRARAFAVVAWAELRARYVGVDLELVLSWVEDRAILAGAYLGVDPEVVLEEIWAIDVVVPRIVDAVMHSLAHGELDGLNA